MTSSNVGTVDKHFVLSTIPAFGHIRPQSGAICKLLRTDPNLLVTIFVCQFLVPVVHKEIEAAATHPAVIARVRVVGIGNTPPPAPGADVKTLFIFFGDIVANVPSAYRTLVEKGTLECTATGKTFNYSDIPAPSVLMLDQFSPGIAPELKALNPTAYIISFHITTSNCFLNHYGPPELGGTEDFEARADAEIAKGDTRTVDEIASARLGDVSGKLEPNVEGVEMYDYEMTPQACVEAPRIPLPMPLVLHSIRQVDHLSDATIMIATRSFEPKSTQAAEQWYQGKLSKRLFFFGPQAPIQPKVYQPPADATEPSNPFSPIWSFLASQQPKSTIVISFGSLWYPSDPTWQIETVVKTLLETNTPFIFSRAAIKYVALPETLVQAVMESKIGMIVDYIPQREMLGHPNLGAFVTHGGVNSMYESILGGVTNIFWPFTADQPVHAAYMSQNLDCAWELIQVRTGPGAGPPRRGGKVEGTPEAVAAELKQVLSEMQGPVGERKRTNLLAVREKLIEEMATSDGVARDLLSFASKPKST